MASFNKVILMGNLTRDPELRVTTGGMSVCKFSIAVSRKYKDKEETTFIDVDSFGDTAERIAQWFVKGRPILVEGRLKTDSWEDKQTGAKRSKIGVALESFQVVAQGRKTSDGGEATDSQESPATEPRNRQDEAFDEDVDVPF